MKRYLFLIVFLFSAISMAGENNPFLELFRQYFPDTSYNVTYKNLNSFVGDSIYFEIEGIRPISNVIKEIPDTVWLKEKRAKKPKEGKDYILCHNYKGQLSGADFSTPVADFNHKIFTLLYVQEIKGERYLNEPIGYELFLVEPETGNRIKVVLDKFLTSKWKLYSKNSNNRIEELKSNHYYQKAHYGSEITVYSLSQGELYLSFDSNLNFLTISPHANFFLISSSGSNPLRISYDSNRVSSYTTESTKFLTASEYEREKDKKRIYTIDYEIRQDTIYKSLISHLPFQSMLGITKNYSNTVSQTIKPGYSPLGYKTLPEKTFILIGDKLNVRGTDYYKGVLEGKSFFIKCEDVILSNPENMEVLIKQPQNVRNAFFERAKVFSRIVYLNEKIDNLEQLEKLMKRGLIVLKARPYDVSEYTDGTGMEFTFFNTSNKTIKYITINFIGYNAVDDPVPSRGKTILTRKGIGPIAPYETGSYDFEYVWFTDIVESSDIKSIIVQYTNGTSKTFTGATVDPVSDDVIDIINDKSLVKDFLPVFEVE